MLLTINSQHVEVEEGLTILQAAEKLGIKIPTLCSHKALSPGGACRLCLVEVTQSGRSTLQTSCTYPALDGLVVETDSEEVIKTRKIMLELLLARCPDADEIKNLARELGVEKTRIKHLKHEDCVLCGLCVRMCEERMGRWTIGFAGRGPTRRVVSPFGRPSEICQVCGACDFVCPTGKISITEYSKNTPTPIISEYNAGLNSRSAVYIPYPQAIPNKATIDRRYCVHLLRGECETCKEFCEADAINFEQQEKEFTVDAGALILSPGYELSDAGNEFEYNYLKSPNVITALEFERILGATGPYKGHLLRPSDQTPPGKIAFIQCVGSRDNRHDYCSSICCMYATKEAIIAKEHAHDPLDCHIYFMDLRAFGKGFEEYYNRAKELGVKYIRSKPSAVEGVEGTDNLRVTYVSEDGHIQHEEYDLVILSTGVVPPESAEEIQEILGVKLNKHGFCRTADFTPIDSSREGIFVCGPFSEPKDIPETVTQASGAAGRALTLLADAKGTMITPKEYPPEKDVRGQEPRIGVFVCHCGINIGGVVKVPEVMEYARTLPNVVYAEENLYTCSEDTQAKIKGLIQEHNLNRVVVSSCTPRTHEPLFQETIREVGLNRHLFEMANIRDQCSWIHRDVPEEATEKAKDLVRMAVAKVRLVEPLPRIPLPVTQRALVIGGGPAGMSAALSLANQGFPVDLVEKENQLGGNLMKVLHLIDGKDTASLLESLIPNVTNHPNIHVHLSSKIQTVEGFVGNYKTTIVDCQLNQASVRIEHGVAIVATGAVESVPGEYLYGEDQRVKTGLEFEKILEESHPEDLPDRAVFIQCVGSREKGHQYCSRVCCTETIKNALTLKRKKPSSEIFVLYRDIRTYGFSESYYRQARDLGVMFLRYESDEKPLVSAGENGLEVKIKDVQLGTQLLIPADMLILAARIDPAPDSEILSQFFKVPLNQDGFFLEAHMKLRPIDFATEGMFLAGMAHSPKSLAESISQGEAAASRAATIISKDIYEAEATIASVNEDICSGCGVCVSVCEFEALQLVETFDGNRVVVVNEAVCKGCGCCGGVCPSGAMEQKGFKTEQILAAIEAALL